MKKYINIAFVAVSLFLTSQSVQAMEREEYNNSGHTTVRHGASDSIIDQNETSTLISRWGSLGSDTKSFWFGKNQGEEEWGEQLQRKVSLTGRLLYLTVESASAVLALIKPFM